jgi:hypothetical protein
MRADALSSDRPVARMSPILLGTSALFIANWLSPIVVRSSSSAFNALAFCVALTFLPISLFWSAAGLPRVRRSIYRGASVCMLAVAVIGWAWNFSTILDMTRGKLSKPMLSSVPFGVGRITAYQIETMPSSAYVSLNLEYRVFPGLLLSREFADVDAPNIDELIVLPSRQLCIRFPAMMPDLAGRDRELTAVIPIHGLGSWEARTLVERDLSQSASDRKGCS